MASIEYTGAVTQANARVSVCYTQTDNNGVLVVSVNTLSGRRASSF